MQVAAIFIAGVFVLYAYLSLVGLRCAVGARHIVVKALGREIADEPSVLQVLALPFILWMSGLAASLKGERWYIARSAELYIDIPRLPASDKRKIREAVRAYREKYSLY